ncbi:unnamed protein product [Closterium sp. NIES-65]|nr:unnamed protein product [Closterium sp. NIES-65]
MVACAPYGGPIATVRDPNHLSRRGSSAGSAAQARQYISVFSAAGRPISRFLWEPPGGRLMGLGWREDAVGGLVLVTVLEDGTVHQEPEVFPLADPGLSEPLTVSSHLPPFRSPTTTPPTLPPQQEPEVFPLADPGLSEPPACMAVLEPVMTSSDDVSGSQVAVLLGTEAALLRVDGDTVQRVGAPEMTTAVQRMAVSASGKLLACFTADGQLHVLLTSDLSRRISHYDTQVGDGVNRLKWLEKLLSRRLKRGQHPCQEGSGLLSAPPPPALVLAGLPGHAIKHSLPSCWRACLGTPSSTPCPRAGGPAWARHQALPALPCPRNPPFSRASMPPLHVCRLCYHQTRRHGMVWRGRGAALLAAPPCSGLIHTQILSPLSLLQIVLPPDAMAWCGEDAVLLSWQHPAALMLTCTPSPPSPPSPTIPCCRSCYHHTPWHGVERTRALCPALTAHVPTACVQIVLPPDAMAWCGEDAVLLSWQHPTALMLVGPGDAIKYSLGGEEDDEEEVEGEEEDGEIEGEAGGEWSRRRAFGLAALRSVPASASALDTTTTTTTDSCLILIPECDGVRLLSSSHSDFISRVPEPTVAAFALASTAPPALLLEAVPAPASALDTTTATTDSCLILIPECDGVRLLSSSHSDFISRVPEPTVAAFALASTAPPALLLEAFGLFERRSGKADEHVRAMGVAVMGEAVRGCMHAAAHEGDVDGQKRLLAAAAFGRAFCRKFPRDRMMSLCKDLRVLNAVRRAEEDGLTNGVRAMETAGMPLTYAQYKELSPARLIARLCSTHHHLLALRVAAFLGLRTESVLEHWAISKILSASQMPDEVLYDTITKQIDTDKRGSLAVSFAAVATVAFHTGRHELATRLLEREVHTGRQVRLLLEMGAFEAALWKAEAGPDADFVLQVLFQLLDKAPEEQVFELLKSHPTARSLFISYCKKSDIPLLMRFYEHSSMHQCVAEQIVKQGLQEGLNRWGAERVRELEAAAELLSRTRDHGFQSKAVEDSVKLLRFQQQLDAAGMQLPPPTTTATATGAGEGGGIGEEEGRRRSVVGASVNETIAACLAAGNHREAQKLKGDFKVPERRYYWLRLQALARLRDWEGLEKLFKERRPLVGLRAFVEACVEQGAVVEAAKYVGRIADAGEREEACVEQGAVVEATKYVGRIGDAGEREEVRKDWVGLGAGWAGERVGLGAFVKACVEQGAVMEAAKYVGRIGDAGEREEVRSEGQGMEVDSKRGRED